MSLVDYDASSDEEEQQHQQEDTSIEEDTRSSTTTTNNNNNNNSNQLNHQRHSTPSSQTSAPHSLSARSSLDQQSEDVSVPLPSPIEKLPDASFLLSSPILSHSVGSDHSSRVAAAMAQNASRKREANGSSSSYIRGKMPKSNLPHSKNIPDTGSGLLVPPQLTGRSNVVTEDISKLFVKKNSPGKS